MLSVFGRNRLCLRECGDSPPLGLSRAGGAGNIVRLRFSLPDGVSPDDVSLRFAPLKYDKHFAFTFTCDDSYVTAYSLVWSLINARWIDDREFRHWTASPPRVMSLTMRL